MLNLRARSFLPATFEAIFPSELTLGPLLESLVKGLSYPYYSLTE